MTCLWRNRCVDSRDLRRAWTTPSAGADSPDGAAGRRVGRRAVRRQSAKADRGWPPTGLLRRAGGNRTPASRRRSALVLGSRSSPLYPGSGSGGRTDGSGRGRCGRSRSGRVGEQGSARPEVAHRALTCGVRAPGPRPRGGKSLESWRVGPDPRARAKSSDMRLTGSDAAVGRRGSGPGARLFRICLRLSSEDGTVAVSQASAYGPTRKRNTPSSAGRQRMAWRRPWKLARWRAHPRAAAWSRWKQQATTRLLGIGALRRYPCITQCTLTTTHRELHPARQNERHSGPRRPFRLPRPKRNRLPRPWCRITTGQGAWRGRRPLGSALRPHLPVVDQGPNPDG